MAQTPPVKEGFRAWGKQIQSPGWRLPFYIPNGKASQSDRLDGSRAFNPMPSEGLGHEDLGLGTK